MRITGILVFLLFLISTNSYSQISGKAYLMEEGTEKAVAGIQIYWKNTDLGTTTKSDGSYTLETHPESKTLVASFIGYKNVEKFIISKKGITNFTLITEGTELEEASVVGKEIATGIDVKSAALNYNISSKELRKAACCNLSESFETNASVDISFADAVTGTKQIEMLGLSGKYVLIQRENIPFARGLNSQTGLDIIPGHHVESLQLTKGLSSVINGYESISGQINIELAKPRTGETLDLNFFVNQGGRSELNILSGMDVGSNSSTEIMAHASTVPFAQDRNDDGFADIPEKRQLNFVNRWSWTRPSKLWEGQIGFFIVNDEKKGGQLSYLNDGSDAGWGFQSKNNRYEVFGKNGYIFPDSDFKSIGLIYSLSHQDREDTYGVRNYKSDQSSFYFNSIYQDAINNNNKHIYKTGISVQGDLFSEELFNDVKGPNWFIERTEIVPGAFIEYVYEPAPNFTFISGARLDYNSFFNKVYFTPRVNARYSLHEHTTIRLGGGRGMRTANVLSENLSSLASSRIQEFDGVFNQAPEVAWNIGFSITQKMKLFDKNMTINGDAFYTYFENKLITDLDLDSRFTYYIYNEGSRSLSALVQLDYELSKKFDLRLAYKYLDSKDNYIQGIREILLTPKNRAFANIAYEINPQWKFDATLNWYGSKRLADTYNNPTEFVQAERSDDFFTLNMQVNKTFKNRIEMYLGVENLLNFRQDNPIVNAENPNDLYFDTNFTWGPIFGRMVYFGLNYNIPRKS